MDQFDLFGSPASVAMLPEDPALDAAVAARLIDEAQRTAGITRSNAGGWHSAPDLTLRGEAPWPAMMRRVVDGVDAAVKGLAQARGLLPQLDHGYAIQAWAMVLGAGDWVIPHDHAEAHFSGAYYADAGDPPPTPDDPAGRLTFQSPTTGRAPIPGLDLFPSTFSVRPRTGMLILFPGHLPHYVHPYRGARPRVCVSFNVRVQPRRPQRG